MFLGRGGGGCKHGQWTRKHENVSSYCIAKLTDLCVVVFLFCFVLFFGFLLLFFVFFFATGTSNRREHPEVLNKTEQV